MSKQSIMLLACWGLLAPALCVSQTGERGVGLVVSCGEGVGIRDRPNRAHPEGVGSISLPSNRILWTAMTDRITDVGPVVAGDAVAVITDSFDTVYGFSRSTGRQLWRREKWASNLGSDGRYFYILRSAYWDLQALEPDSGTVAWSLKLPGRWLGHYPDLLGVYRGLLFTGQAAVDLEKRQVVHAWTSRWPAVSSAWVSRTGDILIGNSEGEITIYDRAFKRLRKIYVGGGEIVEVRTTGKGILAVSYAESGGGDKGMLTFLTRQGNRVWQAAWSSGDLDPPLPPQPLSLAGGTVLVIESDLRRHNVRLTSRKLSNGQINWINENGVFDGHPFACGNTVYVEDIDLIRSFDLQSGIEKTSGGK